MRHMAHMGLALAMATVMVAGSVHLQAAEKLAPAQSLGVPRLGFTSYHDGDGESVTGVRRGTTASRIGLEPGDVILAVNGYHLSHDGAWYRAMARAARQGNATLAIRDWRTGRIAYRHVFLGGRRPTAKSPQYEL